MSACPGNLLENLQQICIKITTQNRKKKGGKRKKSEKKKEKVKNIFKKYGKRKETKKHMKNIFHVAVRRKGQNLRPRRGNFF